MPQLCKCPQGVGQQFTIELLRRVPARMETCLTTERSQNVAIVSMYAPWEGCAGIWQPLLQLCILSIGQTHIGDIYSIVKSDLKARCQHCSAKQFLEYISVLQ